MKIQIILGSTRPGRVIERVGKWVEAAAKEVKDFEVEVVDLADYVMPLLDEAISPRFNPDRKPNEAAKRWLDKVGQADGYIVVTPEYNHAITGALKNAIDYLDFQVVKKPFAIVSYGTVGGARAAEYLKGILIESKAAIVPEAVALLGNPMENFDDSGKLSEALAANPYGPNKALETTLTELTWWARALKTAREQ
jgi:NAD(P)H-dependent FMN reductase